MNLVVDIGNTKTKLGLFAGKRLRKYAEVTTEKALSEFCEQAVYDRVIVSSVHRGNRKKLRRMLGRHVLFLDRHTPLPLKNLYKTPDTLGYDRIAAAVGATMLHPGKDRLVVDAGTCITYEFIDRHDCYYGGGITPGIDIRLRALNRFTSKLPLVKKTTHIPFTGRSTKESIVSGTVGGVIAEVQGMIGRYRETYPDISVILCGGDARFFEKKLKGPIFVYPKLVLVGLNGILQHHASSHL